MLQSIVSDACASYATLDRLNADVKPALQDLVHSTDFFSHYRLNLFNKRCPFWDDENGMCGNIGCAVETLENEDDIPEVWRAKELSKLEGPLAKHPGRSAGLMHPRRPLQGGLGANVGESCVFEYDDECDDRDYCVLEDERAGSKGDYVSLVNNPERFTGYGGEGSKQLWDAIYRENCFQKSSFSHKADLGMSSLPHRGQAAQDFKQMLDAASPGTGSFEADDECLEKRVFYRVISGMHASITVHLCYDFLNQTTGEWQPNLACYRNRLEKYPDRISNLYFDYALVTRAVSKLGSYLRGPYYTYCIEDPSEDQVTRDKVADVTLRAASAPQVFDESLMFINGEGPSLKEDFRSRFRNVSRLMDCVGCDKCRLWGKIQTNGFGTALKVLFETDNNRGDLPALQRTEVVALFNLYARLSESLAYLQDFKRMAGEPELEETRPPPPPKDAADHSEELLLELARLQAQGPRSESIADQFAHEFMLLVTAVKVVLWKWAGVPKALFVSPLGPVASASVQQKRCANASIAGGMSWCRKRAGSFISGLGCQSNRGIGGLRYRSYTMWSCKLYFHKGRGGEASGLLPLLLLRFHWKLKHHWCMGQRRFWSAQAD